MPYVIYEEQMKIENRLLFNNLDLKVYFETYDIKS